MSQPSHNKMSKQGGASTRPEPLSDQPHSKYEKIRDLNSGTFGFVQLCKATCFNSASKNAQAGMPNIVCHMLMR